MKKVCSHTTVYLLLFGICMLFIVYQLYSTAKSTLYDLNFDNKSKSQIITEVDNSFRRNFNNKAYFYNIAGKCANSLDMYHLNKVYKSSDGFLIYPYYHLEDSKNLYSSLENFSSKIKSNKLFISFPNIEIQHGNIFPSMTLAHNANAAKEFRQRLNNSQFLDFWDNTSFGQELDKDQKFYKTDHHWKIEFAFSNFLDLAKKFEKYFNHSLPSYIFDKDSYAINQYKEMFLGSSAKRVGRYFANYVDDLNIIYPQFDTDLHVDYNIYRKYPFAKEGNFNTCFIFDEYIKYDYSINNYVAYTGGYYGSMHTHNNSNYVIDKCVFVALDSYSVPLIPFYSLIFKDVYTVDLRKLDASFPIFDYINNVNPDLFIFQYSPFVLDTATNFKWR